VVYVRTTEQPAAFFGTLRSTLHEMDSALPVYGMRTLEDQVDRSLLTERMIATLAGAFGTGDAACDGRALWSDVTYCRTAY
jgi:hypothetical protein